MDVSGVAVAALVALAAALAVALVMSRRQRARTAELLEDVRSDLERQQDRTVSRAVDTLVTVAREQLGAQTQAGLAHLDSRNEVMDERLGTMQDQIERVTALVKDLEQARERRYGEIASQLQRTGERTAELTRTAQSLREALAKPQARGQWGERMAEDVLRTAGFTEGVSYVKQETTSRGRPDFTFLLPDEQRLHMDVKFPLDNYLRFLEADVDTEREAALKAFLRDVKDRIRELAGRDYAEPGSLDYVLLFLPNEHVYGFVHEQDDSILDEALERRVVLCSPLTLFAVLGVVRQAVDNFAFEATSREILELLGAFSEQWEKFNGHLEKVGDRLASTRRAYEDVVGVRRRQLQRQLDKIEDLRTQRATVALADRRGRIGAVEEEAPGDVA